MSFNTMGTIKCECIGNCSLIEFEFCDWHDTQEVFLNLYIQPERFKKDRLKQAWNILRGKDYLYHEMFVSKEKFIQLLKQLNSFNFNK